jgi:hypothetical protein
MSKTEEPTGLQSELVCAQAMDEILLQTLDKARKYFVYPWTPLIAFVLYSQIPGRSAVIAAPEPFANVTLDERRKIPRMLGRRIADTCDPLYGVFMVYREADMLAICGRTFSGASRCAAFQGITRDWLSRPTLADEQVVLSTGSHEAPYSIELEYLLRGRSDAIRHRVAGKSLRKSGAQFWPGPPLRPEYRDWLN